MHRFLLPVALTLAGCVSNPGSIVEAGYPTGSLAVAAIDRGDWATAERLLTAESRLDADDPARLINLGRVYLETGRPAQAAAAWRQALASDRHVEVETLGGRTARTDEIARAALARHAEAEVVAAR